MFLPVRANLQLRSKHDEFGQVLTHESQISRLTKSSQTKVVDRKITDRKMSSFAPSEVPHRAILKCRIEPFFCLSSFCPWSSFMVFANLQTPWKHEEFHHLLPHQRYFAAT